jgi:hypothetical protein
VACLPQWQSNLERVSLLCGDVYRLFSGGRGPPAIHRRYTDMRRGIVITWQCFWRGYTRPRTGRRSYRDRHPSFDLQEMHFRFGSAYVAAMNANRPKNNSASELGSGTAAVEPPPDLSRFNMACTSALLN